MKIKLKQDGTIKTFAAGRIKSIALIIAVADEESQEVFVYYKDGGKRVAIGWDRLIGIGRPQILYCIDAGIDCLKPYLDKETNTLDITSFNTYTNVESEYAAYLKAGYLLYEDEPKSRI